MSRNVAVVSCCFFCLNLSVSWRNAAAVNIRFNFSSRPHATPSCDFTDIFIKAYILEVNIYHLNKKESVFTIPEFQNRISHIFQCNIVPLSVQMSEPIRKLLVEMEGVSNFKKPTQTGDVLRRFLYKYLRWITILLICFF